MLNVCSQCLTAVSTLLDAVLTYAERMLNVF